MKNRLLMLCIVFYSRCVEQDGVAKPVHRHTKNRITKIIKINISSNSIIEYLPSSRLHP